MGKNGMVTAQLPQVEQSLDTLRERIHLLSEAVEHMGGRLHMVLTDDRPMMPAERAGTGEDKAPLARAIDGTADLIGDIQCRINNILARLQI
jgi:hypothetical protein